jgi:hypothetical protein
VSRLPVLVGSIHGVGGFVVISHAVSLNSTVKFIIIRLLDYHYRAQVECVVNSAVLQRKLQIWPLFAESSGGLKTGLVRFEVGLVCLSDTLDRAGLLMDSNDWPGMGRSTGESGNATLLKPNQTIQ